MLDLEDKIHMTKKGFFYQAFQVNGLYILRRQDKDDQKNSHRHFQSP